MNANTIEFLRHLFIQARGYFELTAIHPERAKGNNIKTRAYELGRDTIDWNQVDNMNADGWGIYYGVTTSATRPPDGRRRREVDVLTMPCVWCEIDVKDGHYPDNNAILSHLYDFDYPPSFLISSGGGIHSIWMIDPVEVTPANTPHLKQILRGLAVYLHGDTAATDLARVLRLPGTINTKPDRNGARCEIVDRLEGQFTIDDFADYAAYAAPVDRPIERDLPRHRPDDLPRKVQAYLDAACVSGTRNAELNTAAYIMHTEGYSQSETERILAPKAMADGLPEREVMRTIQSAYAAAPGVPRYLSKRGGLRMRAGDALRRARGKRE